MSEMKIEIDDDNDRMISIRIPGELKSRYEKLRYVHKVKNLTKMFKQRFSEFLDEVEDQIKDKAG